MWRIYSIDGVLFLLHRITGIALLVFLLAHIWVISTALLSGPETFNDIMKFLAQPGFLVTDALLLGSITFHAVNGIRLLAHEHGLWLESADALARVTVFAWLGLWCVAGAFAMAA